MTVTVTATVEPSVGPMDLPRVMLAVSASAGETQATIMRQDPDGRLVQVRTNDDGPVSLSGGAGLTYDYEAPFQAAIRYSSLESPATVSADVTVDEPNVWLIHPAVPELSMPISVAEFGPQTRPVVRAVYQPLGRKNAVVQTDGQRKAPEGSIEMNTLTSDEREAFEALTDDAADLLLNIPAGLGWGIPSCYVALGDLGEARLMHYAAEPRRVHTLPYTVVDRPIGGTQAERTYGDLLVAFDTYAEMAAAYDSYLALLTGP